MKLAARLFSLCLSILLVVTFFSACGGNGDTSSADAGKLADKYINTADISFIDADGESTYRIVRPSNATDDETDAAQVAAQIVFKAIKEKCGVTIRNEQESDGKPENAEILIGETERESTKKAKEIFFATATGRDNEYIIATIDNDIVIYGTSENALKTGAEYFVNTYVGKEPVTGGINKCFTDVSQYTDLKIFGKTNLSDVKIVRPIYNVSYLTLTETDKMIEAITKKTGYFLKTVKDQVASNTGNSTDGSGTLTPTEASEYEIVIGNCARDGVTTISDVDAYEVKIQNKKIFINGGSAHATAIAVSEFTKILTNATELTAANNLTGSYSETIETYDNATTYKKVWGDDFNGTSINESLWVCDWWAPAGYTAHEGKQALRGNKDLENNYVKDGKFYIDALQDDDYYYGGKLHTSETMYYLYGYVEFSCLNPKGSSFWTAVWGGSTANGAPMVNDPHVMYASETDINECYGPGTWVYGNTFAWPTAYGREALEIPKGTQGTVHVNNVRNCWDDRGFWMDFHTYGFEWIDNTHVRFTCDGEVYADQKLREGAEQHAYSYPQMFMISMAVGSKGHPLGTDENEWKNTNKFITDWINVYQVKSNRLWTGTKGNFTEVVK